MEKIKITAEQKETLDSYTSTGLFGLEDFIRSKDEYKNTYVPLKTFTPEEFAVLLCGWYEVEQPFKVGDWVLWKEYDEYLKIIKIDEKISFKNGTYCSDSFAYEHLEKVTEPLKIILLELGREEPEFKVGDKVITVNCIHFTFRTKEECNIDYLKSIDESGIEYFYPVESCIEVK